MDNGYLFSLGSIEYSSSAGTVSAFIIGSIMFEVFLYGIYSVLFMIWVYKIFQRQHKIHQIFQALGPLMYLIASTDIGLTIGLLFEKMLKGNSLAQYLKLKYLLYVTNKYSVIVSMLYTLESQQTPIDGASNPTRNPISLTRLHICLTLVLNVILTILIASRIWWISRLASKTVQPDLSRRYLIALLIFIESGFIYCVYMVLALSVSLYPVLVLNAGLIQIVGIMPTLILVQVALRRTVEDVNANSRVPTDTRDAQIKNNIITFRIPSITFSSSGQDQSNNGLGHCNEHDQVDCQTQGRRVEAIYQHNKVGVAVLDTEV